MEDENGGLYVPEGSVATTGRKSKTVKDYEGWRMGGSWQKGTRNNTAVHGFIGGFQYLKRKKIEGVMIALGNLYEKPLASNKVFLMKRLFNMKMSEGGFVADHLNEFNTLTSE